MQYQCAPVQELDIHAAHSGVQYGTSPWHMPSRQVRIQLSVCEYYIVRRNSIPRAHLTVPLQQSNSVATKIHLRGQTVLGPFFIAFSTITASQYSQASTKLLSTISLESLASAYLI